MVPPSMAGCPKSRRVPRIASGRCSTRCSTASASPAQTGTACVESGSFEVGALPAREVSGCGVGRLFAGYLKLRPSCENCGLDLAFADSGDGPAVFIILIVGAVIIGAAAAVEGLFHPAPFVHLLLWIPGTIILSLLLLRPHR